jgi:hypothetical protein
LKVLDQRIFDDLQVIIELQMPVGAERADIVLLGDSPETPKGLIIDIETIVHCLSHTGNARS